MAARKAVPAAVWVGLFGPASSAQGWQSIREWPARRLALLPAVTWPERHRVLFAAPLFRVRLRPEPVSVLAAVPVEV
jgi:hypothetical protein